MNIPDKIIISGMEYKVVLTDNVLLTDISQRAYGHIDFENKVIEIDKTLTDEQGNMQTLLHEILHGIVFDRNIDFKNDNEETIINQLARGLYQMLKDNKIF